MRVGIDAERVSAIFAPPVNSMAGKIGCLLSHLKVVTIAKERCYDNVLILEDDAMFRPNFTDEWVKLLPQVKTLDYDLFYFNHWSGGEDSGDYKILSNCTTYCTHCYSVHSRFYRKFIELCSEFCGKQPVDTILCNSKAKTYLISPSLVGQSEGHSLIDNIDRAARWGRWNNL